MSPEWFHVYLRLARYDRPIGSYLVLQPFLLTSALCIQNINDVIPFIQNGLLFTISAMTLRGGGCIVNDFWDRKIDNQVERTK